MEPLMTRAEVQDFVKHSTTSIYRLIRLGQFPPPIRIGVSAVRWRPEDMREWLDSRPTTKELNGRSK